MVFTGLTGCSSAHYRKSADRQVYRIIGQSETNQFGKSSGFNIDTSYSSRDPKDVAAEEIIGDRIQNGVRYLTVADALALAVANSRAYQTRKEQLYLVALTLTKNRHDFQPIFSGGSTGTVQRNSDSSRQDSAASRVSATQALQSGGHVGLAVANDIIRYYTGDPSRTAVSTLSLDIVQPLLRGAGAEAAAENLTQAERNVIYEVRSFSRYQTTFAVDVVVAYFRLLQRKDTVRNEYNTYLTLVKSRERSEALAVDRLPQYQVDQARQDELSAKARYLQTIESYKDALDSFKDTLGLPRGVEIRLEDKTVAELSAIGLPPVSMDERHGYELAVKKRLDLINEIDRFEDAKRKVRVTADSLKTDLNVFAHWGIDSGAPADYTHFSLHDYRLSTGMQLGLPLDRLAERNDFRATLIGYERELRQLAISLDGVRDNVRQGLRALELARQTYEIQRLSVELADRRVDSAELLLQAGRAQIRDLLDAQNAQLTARNSFVVALFDYHTARLSLLRDLGTLNINEPSFWLKGHEDQKMPGKTVAASADAGGEVITPEQLFGK